MFLVPGEKGTRICNHFDLQCMQIARDNIYVIQGNVLDGKNPDGLLCNCYPQCYSVEYDYSLSQATIEPFEFRDKRLNITK
jgi:hypothetical protein